VSDSDLLLYRTVAFPSVTDLDEEISSPHLHLLIVLAVIYFVLCLVQIISLKIDWCISLISWALFVLPYFSLCVLIIGSAINGARIQIPEFTVGRWSVLWESDVSF